MHLLGKGNRARIAAITADTSALIELLPGGRHDPDAFLFLARSGDDGHLSRQAIHGAVAKWGQRVAVAAFPHALGPTYATATARRAADLTLIGRTLGHRSPSTTAGYVAADPTTSSSLLLG